jgi:magnesium-transporting ATPase (P-type)
MCLGQSIEALKKELDLDDHLLSLDDFLERYETNIETGLSSEEVAKRQAQYGLNVLTPMKVIYLPKTYCNIKCMQKCCNNLVFSHEGTP